MSWCRLSRGSPSLRVGTALRRRYAWGSVEVESRRQSDCKLPCTYHACIPFGISMHWCALKEIEQLFHCLYKFVARFIKETKRWGAWFVLHAQEGNNKFYNSIEEHLHVKKMKIKKGIKIRRRRNSTLQTLSRSPMLSAIGLSWDARKHLNSNLRYKFYT
jgi:hypothetical protein